MKNRIASRILMSATAAAELQSRRRKRVRLFFVILPHSSATCAARPISCTRLSPPAAPVDPAQRSYNENVQKNAPGDSESFLLIANGRRTRICRSCQHAVYTCCRGVGGSKNVRLFFVLKENRVVTRIFIIITTSYSIL